MQRTYTTVGQDFNQEGAIRAKLDEAIARLKWRALPCNLPMMPGLGIEETIKQLRIPKTSHVAISNAMAPFGLYGIRGHFKNGMAEIFVIDHGDALTCVCSDFYPNAAVETASNGQTGAGRPLTRRNSQ